MVGSSGGLAPHAGSTMEGLPIARPSGEQPEFDVTAMVDLVSLMNIYFLITLAVGAGSEIDLPRARRSRPLDAEVATMITVLPGRDVNSVVVYLGEGEGEGRAITDATEQEEQIASVVDAAVARQKTEVLIKAEKAIRLREIRRISAAASREGATLNMAVWEKDESEDRSK